MTAGVIGDNGTTLRIKKNQPEKKADYLPFYMIFYSYLITRKSFSWVKSANKSPKTVRLTYTSETENDHLNFVIVCLEFHQIFKGVAGCYCLNSIFFFWLPNFAIAESFVNARHFPKKAWTINPTSNLRSGVLAGHSTTTGA